MYPSRPTQPKSDVYPLSIRKTRLDNHASRGKTTSLIASAPPGRRPPRSGTILEHPGHPPLSVTVHLATLPLESLSRGVDRSFVGAPPLRLAAFRRLLDRPERYRNRHRSLAMPATRNDQGVGDGGRDHVGSGAEEGLRYGSGLVYGATGTNGSGGAEDQESDNGGLEHGETVDAGGGAAGLGDRELELERAGYLIEVRLARVVPRRTTG